MLSAILAGAHFLQATSTDNSGFFSRTCVLACVKTVEIFEFIDNLDTAGYLLDNKKH